MRTFFLIEATAKGESFILDSLQNEINKLVQRILAKGKKRAKPYVKKKADAAKKKAGNKAKDMAVAAAEKEASKMLMKVAMQKLVFPAKCQAMFKTMDHRVHKTLRT